VWVSLCVLVCEIRGVVCVVVGRLFVCVYVCTCVSPFHFHPLISVAGLHNTFKTLMLEADTSLEETNAMMVQKMCKAMTPGQVEQVLVVWAPRCAFVVWCFVGLIQVGVRSSDT
jgi:hypothetical protein